MEVQPERDRNLDANKGEYVMTDALSSAAYQALKASGKLGKAQAQYLRVFMDHPEGYTHAQATLAVYNNTGRSYPARNGRIAELAKLGFIKKNGTAPGACGTLVNVWVWTGRTEPLPVEGAWIKCCHCDGKGGKYGDVPVSENQGDFLK